VSKKARFSPIKNEMRFFQEDFNEAMGDSTWRKKGRNGGLFTSPTPRNEAARFSGPVLVDVEKAIQGAKIDSKGKLILLQSVGGGGGGKW
jgi:hypothetical protein